MYVHRLSLQLETDNHPSKENLFHQETLLPINRLLQQGATNLKLSIVLGLTLQQKEVFSLSMQIGTIEPEWTLEYPTHADSSTGMILIMSAE